MLRNSAAPVTVAPFQHLVVVVVRVKARDPALALNTYLVVCL